MCRDLYFSKTLFEGLIFGGAYVWREICLSKSIGLALWLERNLLFLLCFTLYLRAISTYKPPRGLYLEGQFNGGSFAFQVWGAYIWRGLYMEGLIFGILRYLQCIFQLVQPFCSTMLNKLCLASSQENCVFATKCWFFRQEGRSLNKS